MNFAALFRWPGVLLWLLLAVSLASCERSPATPNTPGSPAATVTPKPPPSNQVVLYSSLDGDVLEPLVRSAEAATGLKVLIVGDTEATKAVGLVQRLLAERERPKADVWWSSEAAGSLRLAGEGVLEPFVPEGVSDAAGWGVKFQGVRHRWHAVGQRPRVIVVNTQQVPEAQWPRTLRDLGEARFKGRVGLCDATIGTALGHLAAIYATEGEDATRAWLRALKANDVRTYPGNGAVARAVATGEIHVGVVDLDDVLAGQANDWPVAVAPMDARTSSTQGLLSGGTMMTPGTIGLIAGGPNPAGGKRLIEFLCSEASERALASGPQRWVPVRTSLANLTLDIVPADAVVPDWDRVHALTPSALKLWQEEMR